MIENAKKSILNEKIDDFEQKNLEKQIAEIKKSYGLDGVEIEYSCPLCKDEGYKNGQMCKCLKRQISKELLKNSGFEKLESFENAMKTCGDLLPVCKRGAKAISKRLSSISQVERASERPTLCVVWQTSLSNKDELSKLSPLLK